MLKGSIIYIKIGKCSVRLFLSNNKLDQYIINNDAYLI